jgi:hypothetical protein
MEIHGLNIRIKIGANEVLRCPEWRIDSQRHQPLGRARIVLPDPFGELWKTLVPADDGLAITYGYRGQESAAWNGAVSCLLQGPTCDQIEISAIDGAEALATTKITQAWENESPEAIVTWAIRQAGFTPGRIGVTGLVLPRFVASAIPVWLVAEQAAHSCQRGFDLDMSRWALWLGLDGRVNWGDFDEPGPVPEIATGAGLIDHAPDKSIAGLHKVETFLRPGLMHSQLFRLRDTKRGIDGTFRALRVSHRGIPDQVRTFIWYGTEYVRF